MQKKLIALAVAALAAGSAFAQSNVTVYGIVDVGFTNRSSNIAKHTKSQNAINSGQSAPSLIGFTGVEDLGNGNKVLFVLENGFQTDTGADNSPYFDEQAFLGATGGWGTAIAGRLVAPRHGFLKALDPFHSGTVGQYRNVYLDQATTDVARVNNAVAYVSPTFTGFNVTAAYATHAGILGDQEHVANKSDLRTYTLLPRYTNGPLDVGFAWQYVKIKDASPAARQSQWTLGASYDFGAVKLSAAYDNFSAKNAVRALNGAKKVNSWLLGLSVPFGKSAVQFSFNQNRAKDNGGVNEKARQFAVGYTYSLSKRTNFYAAFATIRDDKEGGVYTRTAAVGDATNGGAGYKRGLQFGLKHNF